MVEPLPTLLAVVAVVLMGLALVLMSADNFMMAGMSFLSASLVIYLRERRLKDGG